MTGRTSPLPHEVGHRFAELAVRETGQGDHRRVQPGAGRRRIKCCVNIGRHPCRILADTGILIVFRHSPLDQASQRLQRTVADKSLFVFAFIAAEQGLKRVRFLGTLEQDALCKVYAAADVLVLPSRSEAWGLVLNEGMEFGLPVIASDSVGAVPDLLPEEENGFIVPVGDVKALGSALGRLMEDEALRRRMSEASRRIIEGFTPERWAKGVLRAVDAVAGDIQ